MIVRHNHKETKRSGANQFSQWISSSLVSRHLTKIFRDHFLNRITSGFFVVSTWNSKWRLTSLWLWLKIINNYRLRIQQDCYFELIVLSFWKSNGIFNTYISKSSYLRTNKNTYLKQCLVKFLGIPLL